MSCKAAIALLFTAILTIRPTSAIWPEPRSILTGTTPVILSSGFDITVSGSVHNAPTDLHQAIARSKNFIKTDKLERLVVGRGAADANAIKGAKQLSKLSLALTTGANAHSIASEVQKALDDRDESYKLTVPSSGGEATLVANTTLGLFRGLTTFEQLWYQSGSSLYTLVAPIEIEDAPAYPYRGFMLDTARNFFPVSDIQRTLDAMSMVKINTFHWHVVDSQSFPLQIPGYTELAEQGAYSADMVYTPSDVASIVSYAGDRGIDVMVEIDTPGHTAIISKAHPELVACAEATPWSSFANEPPAGQLRFTLDSTVTYTTGLLSAVAKMFPSTLISTGGDELNTNCYAEDEETQQNLNTTGQTLEQALDVFTQTTHGALEKMGKTPVVWEEMVLVHNVTLSNETLVLVWISSDDVKGVAEKGFKIVHAASDYFYLDCGGGGWVGNFTSGNSWCDPFKTWQKSYSFDPLTNLTAEEIPLVKGGEHLLWTEQSSPSNLDPIVWPRAASSAELYWSGAGGDSDTALPRLHDVAFRMKQRGIDAIPLQPLWCALRPGACDLDA